MKLIILTDGSLRPFFSYKFSTKQNKTKAKIAKVQLDTILSSDSKFNNTHAIGRYLFCFFKKMLFLVSPFSTD